VHVKHLYPLPKNLGDLLRNFDTVMVPELNNGQFVRIIRSEFLIDAKPLSKIKGLPFSSTEIKQEALKYLQS
jgi:2-oxoglutarate ferredoxin oxidoreductase subunit alpha